MTCPQYQCNLLGQGFSLILISMGHFIDVIQGLRLCSNSKLSYQVPIILQYRPSGICLPLTVRSCWRRVKITIAVSHITSPFKSLLWTKKPHCIIAVTCVCPHFESEIKISESKAYHIFSRSVNCGELVKYYSERDKSSSHFRILWELIKHVDAKMTN